MKFSIFNFQFSIKNNGFTLVETLVAVSIFSVAILGLLAVIASGVSDTRYAKQKVEASYLAQEGIEYIRNMRDNYVLYATNGNPWNNFKAKLASCNAGNACGFNSSVAYTDSASVFQCGNCKLYLTGAGYGNAGSTESGFIREIWMDSVGADQVKIYSKVSWVQASGNYDVTFTEDLYNWVE